jgi:hypothetical protein
MKGGKALMTVLYYERCAVDQVLDVIAMPPIFVIGSIFEL